ncbi:triadin-like [Helianthus annuus]|uniref:triadin-like n=1 Tax=Helianthus annuus TaxID=4232 RepID=UPI000B8F5500|nr:triadin-like [Helianthus annuus]
MDFEEDLLLYYYISREESPFKIEEEAVLKESISKEPVSIKKDSETVLDKAEKGLEVDLEKAENNSEAVSEKVPVFDHSSDEESTLEKLKNKQAAKMKIDEAANVKENVKSEENQVDSLHQKASEQVETTVLSQNDEVKPEEQVEEIPAVKDKNEADDKKILGMCLNCEKSKSENVKLLRDVDIGYSLMNVLDPKAGGAIVVAYLPEERPLETRKKKKVDKSEGKRAEEPTVKAPRKRPSTSFFLDYVVISDTLSGLDAGDKRAERDPDDDATMMEIMKKKKVLEDKKKELDEQAAAALSAKKSKLQKETPHAPSESEIDLGVFSAKHVTF